MSKCLFFLMVITLYCVGPASGQLVVHDPGNATINTVTSLQATISAVENVIQSGYMLLELTPLDDIALAGEFAETMSLLGDLVAEGRGLMGDAASAQAQIDALFGIEAPARNLSEFAERMAEIRAVLYETRRYAIRVQTLISNLNSAVGHILRIVDIISALAGNMQANQAQIQLLAVANQTLAVQTAQNAAQQRADVLDRLARSYVVESYRVIEAQRWADWPSFAALGMLVAAVAGRAVWIS